MFVSSLSKPRLFKLAHAIGLSGHRVSLISGARYGDRERRYFDCVAAAAGPWEILERLEEMTPDVVHLFGNYDNFRMLPVARFSPAPVVFDAYDVLRGMKADKWQADWIELRAERRLFEHADHICARHMEPYVLKRRFGYELPGSTFFPDYCWGPPARRRRQPSEDPHVVYCGNVMPEDRYSREEAGFAQYLGVGRTLAKQRIHLHIYPACGGLDLDFDRYFALYLRESETNPYFHFYRPLPYDQLIERLAEYDAALHAFDELGRVTEDKLRYSTANKLFDYIEAGLPVIIHRGRLQRSIVRRCGTAVTVESLENLRAALESALRAGRAPVDRCDLAYHAPRLARMYERVAGLQRSVPAGVA